nr:CLIP domain-containing serine protease 14D-like [Maniola hyperantus]
MCGEIDGSRIIGGKIAKLYEFPWMTLIAYNTRNGQQFSCGGSIINSRYILTAAHCVTSGGVLKDNIAHVHIGDVDYSTETDCQGDYENMICETKVQDVGIDEIIPHEDFTGRAPMQADIALLRLNESIIFRNNVAPICLPVYSELRNNILGGKKATVAGWGSTETENQSTKLLKVDIPILTDDVCGSYYRRFDENMIVNSFCAGELMKDSCGGDSGGPLMMETEFGNSIRLVQFGVVSFGPTQCGSRFPGVYTDVRKYMDWILDNIRGQCFDCVSIRSCESALDYAERVFGSKRGSSPAFKRDTFLKAVCGFEGRNPKVCCSDFPRNSWAGITLSIRAPLQALRTVDAIELHPNVELLPDSCGDIDGSRIVGGRVAKLYELPWMTLIAYNTRDGKQFNCAGSIINSRYVLTAAHCVLSPTEGLKNIIGIRIGDIDLDKDIDCQGDFQNMFCESATQNIGVEEVIIHEVFVQNASKDTDIALLRLSESVNFTYKNAGPICLPVSSELRDARLAGKNATVAGWGATEYDSSSRILLKIEIPIWSDENCHPSCKRDGDCKTRNFKTLCAGEYLKDSCSGDSGGPLIVETQYNGVHRYVQYGIVSHGPRRCGTRGDPGVYTDVSKYMQWILDKIRK